MSEIYPLKQWPLLVTLHFISLVGVIGIFFTAWFARSCPRYPTWFNFVWAWIIWTFSWSFMVLTGQLKSGSNIPHSLCLIQGTLIYAIPILTSATTLVFVLQTWQVLRSILGDGSASAVKGNHGSTTRVILLVVPYAIWLAAVLLIFVYGLQNPETVIRINHVQCLIRAPDLIEAAASLSNLIEILFAKSVRTAIIGYYLMRFNKSVVGSPEYAPIIRVVLFAFLVILSLVAEISVLVDEKTYGSEWFAFQTAILALGGLLIFGSQTDVLRVWMFWIPRRLTEPCTHV
ncbi:hypothetical protein C8J56DRAFT_1044299 [Mycena floridula]|nr:hypothetical protein C8J56DRAFT_1044299 [Mycena floridula]